MDKRELILILQQAGYSSDAKTKEEALGMILSLSV